MKELTNEKLTTTNNEDNFLELCKICLSAYSLLPKIASSIDSLVVAKASASIFLPELTHIEENGEKIIRLTNKKVALINLKLFIDESLNLLSDTDIRLISARYIDNLKKDTCLKLFNISERGFYRKITRALDLFKRHFFKKIVENREVSKEIFGEMLLTDILNNVSEFKNKGGDIDLKGDLICDFIVRKLRKL